MIAAWWVAEGGFTFPNLPTPAGIAAVVIAATGLLGVLLKFRGQQVTDWGDLIERQEKTIIRLEAEVENIRGDLATERAETGRLWTIAEKRRRILIENNIEVPE